MEKIDWNAPTMTCGKCSEEKPTEDFRRTSGRKCRSCRNLYALHYQRTHKKPKPPKREKTREEILQELTSRMERKKQQSLKSRMKQKAKRTARKAIENLKARKRKRNPDREFYIRNRFWGIDNFRFYSDFSDLLKMPMEQLDFQYWKDKEEFSA